MKSMADAVRARRAAKTRMSRGAISHDGPVRRSVAALVAILMAVVTLPALAARAASAGVSLSRVP